MYNKLTNGMRLVGAIKPVLLFSSALILSACVSDDKGEQPPVSSSSVVSSTATSSSAAISSMPVSSAAESSAPSSMPPASSVASSSSAVVVSSSVAVSSSSIMQSSSVSSVISSSISSQASSQMSSSAPSNELGAIVPRTSCPKGPVALEVAGGAWPPAYAHATNHDNDVVPDFKDYMKEQPRFETADVSMAWALHEPFQAEGNPEGLYPLVVYLHGGSEAMDTPFMDNRHAKSFFASSQSLLTPQNRENKPAYIFAPFCDSKAPSGKKCAFGGAEWASNGYGAFGAELNGKGSPYGAAVEAVIERLIATKQVDPARIYVTGPSMGGGGSWDLAGRRPDLIAAAIPLAGHPLNDASLQTLADYKVPVWSHHGKKDATNSYSVAKTAIASLANKGGCAWQTAYIPSQNLADDDPADSNPSDAIHNIWARAYTNPELWDWVFAQRQPRSGDVVEESSSSQEASSSVGVSSSAASSTGTVGNPDAVLFQDDFEGDSIGSLPKNWSFYHRYSQQNPNTNDVSVVEGNGGKAVMVKDIGGQAPSFITYEPANPESITQLYIRAMVKPSRALGNDSGINHSHFIATQKTPYSSNDAEFRFGEVKKGLGIGTSQPDDLAPSGQATANHSTALIPADTWSCIEVGIHTEGDDKVTSWMNDELLIEVGGDTPWQNGAGSEFMQGAFNLVLLGWHGFSASTSHMMFDDIVISTERIGCGGSTQASSSMGSSSSEGSVSSFPADDGTVLDANNHYDAPKAAVAPVIDGEIDGVWASATWMAMDVAWTGFEGLTAPSSSDDFNGKYKAIWDEDYLYLLFDITDDVINTDGQYYQQDTVELFIDEDQSGGQHNQSYNAFAYHVSHNLVVEDNGGNNYKTHITAAINTEGSRHVWEIRVKIFADHNGYVPSEEAAARIKLAAGKIMGFTPSYIDNDGNGRRDHFMSSVNTPGHQDNQGYLNADAFGSIMLID